MRTSRPRRKGAARRRLRSQAPGTTAVRPSSRRARARQQEEFRQAAPSPRGKGTSDARGSLKGSRRPRGSLACQSRVATLLIYPFRWVELRVGTAQSHIDEEASSSVGYCDYRPGDRTMPDRLRCGRIGSEAGLLPTLANALYGPMGGFSRNPVNVRSLVAIMARYLSTTSTTSHPWHSYAGGGAAHSIIADTSQKPAP